MPPPGPVMPISVRKILLVDDDPHLAGIAELALTRFGGYEVTYVSSGAEALERFAEVRPDLVLLDIKMPGMDGFETLARLRADEAGARVPVITFTSLCSASQRATYREAGVLGTIGKPFDPGTLHEEVERLLDGEQSA